MFSKDWILRQIEMLSRAAAKLIFNKETQDDYMLGEYSLTSDNEYLAAELKLLVDNNMYCEAEDRLFFYMEEHPFENVVDVAFEFYANLNDKSDEELEAFNFPREEIADGIERVAKFYGLKKRKEPEV